MSSRYRYDIKDTPESPTRLPPRQHASTGENTSFDTPELLTIGEDISSEIPALLRNIQGHGHRNRDEICQILLGVRRQFDYGGMFE